MTINKIVGLATLATFIIAGLGAGYAGVDRFISLEERVSANTEQIQTDQWLLLNARIGRGDPVSKSDWVRWCKWGLRWRLHTNCQRPPPPRSGPRRPRPRPR